MVKRVERGGGLFILVSNDSFSFEFYMLGFVCIFLVVFEFVNTIIKLMWWDGMGWPLHTVCDSTVSLLAFPLTALSFLSLTASYTIHFCTTTTTFFTTLTHYYMILMYMHNNINACWF